jgi:hypothetical protein
MFEAPTRVAGMMKDAYGVAVVKMIVRKRAVQQVHLEELDVPSPDFSQGVGASGL